MSLEKKINDEMDQLAIRIIRRAYLTNDEKLRRMCESWFDLKQLLEKASELEQGLT